MGSQASDNIPVTYPAEVVAAAFVESYYQILHASPQEAHHFYEDNSVLGRPEADGKMTNVTTMKAIGEKIMSLDYKDSLATIVSVHAQGTIMGGVIVGVTGFLTGKDNVKRNFSQTFFLARHKTGYFVLNDFLHFLEPETLPAPLSVVHTVEENTSNTSAVIEATVNVSGQTETKNSSSVEQVAVPEQSETKNSSVVEEGAVFDQSEKIKKNSSVEQEGVSDQSKEIKKNSSVKQVAVSESLGNKSQKTDALVSNAKDVKKTSYASIVAKENIVTSPVTAPISKVKVAANSNQQQPRSSAPPTPSPKAPASAPPNPHQQPRVSAPPNSQQPRVPAAANANQQEHASSVTPSEGAHLNSNGHAGAMGIYIGGLPMDINNLKLKAAVEKFGSVKQDGIQIRRYEDGFTFGFVEFESSKSAQNAVEAHTIVFEEKEAYIDFKRSTVQGGGNRGRFPSAGNGYFRNMERSNEAEGRPNVNRGGYYSGQPTPPRGYSWGPLRGGPFVGRNGEGNRRGFFYQNSNGGRVGVRCGSSGGGSN